MGSIVKFVARTYSVRRAAPAEVGAPHVCEIIILPCVRYERRTDDAGRKPSTQKKPPQKKKVKRRARSR